MPHPRSSVSAPAHPSAGLRLCGPIVLGLLLPTVVGCAGWLPWTTSERAKKNAELYGPTANQRIKSLESNARQAKADGGGAEIEFTRGLAEEVLVEHDARVRCEMVAIAGMFDTTPALAICKGAMQDPDDRVRVRACRVWGQRGGPEAVRQLSNSCRADRDLDVRLEAIRMLGQLEDEAAIPVLADVLSDPDPAVQYRAVAALKEVSGRDLGNDVNAWREWAADPGRAEPWSIAEAWRKLF
ncbi:HEAT repeat domain-containing protein [bacterium]|nr:HEAT repeat domain-containing protein [bacterium]